jgi:hypothetical protein
MAILAVGGEADTYTLPSGMAFAHETNSARFEANASRIAMLVTTGVSEIRLPFGSTPSSFWAHMYIYHESLPASASTYIAFQNASGSETEYRITMNADGTWTIARFIGGSFTTIGTTASSVISGASAVFDFEIVRNAVTGVFNIYKDGASIFSFTGNTNTDAAVGSIRFVGLTGGSNEMNVSQVIIADETTLGFKLATLAPDGNGTNTAWTNDFTAVDEAALSTGDFIETNATSQTETYTAANINAAYSTFNVKAVVVAQRTANDSGSVVNDVQAAVRTAGTNYFSSNLSLPKDGSGYSLQNIWGTNPNTAAAWTQTEVNAVEIGLRSV